MYGVRVLYSVLYISVMSLSLVGFVQASKPQKGLTHILLRVAEK